MFLVFKGWNEFLTLIFLGIVFLSALITNFLKLCVSVRFFKAKFQ